MNRPQTAGDMIAGFHSDWIVYGARFRQTFAEYMADRCASIREKGTPDLADALKAATAEAIRQGLAIAVHERGVKL